MSEDDGRASVIHGRCDMCVEMHELHADHQHVGRAAARLICPRESLCRWHCGCVVCLTDRAAAVATRFVGDAMTDDSLADSVGGTEVGIVLSGCDGEADIIVVCRGRTMPAMAQFFNGDSNDDPTLVLFVGESLRWRRKVAKIRERIARSEIREVALTTCAAHGRFLWALAAVNPGKG